MRLGSFTNIIAVILASMLSLNSEGSEPCNKTPEQLDFEFPEMSLYGVERALQKVEAQTEVSPFATACADPALLKDRPTTGALGQVAPLRDKQGHTSRDFLKRLIARIKKETAEHKATIDGIETCLAAPSDQSRTCVGFREFVDKIIPAQAASARGRLALAETESHVSSVLDLFSDKKDTLAAAGDRVSFLLNDQLKPLGTTKHVAWDPLTPDEIMRYKKILMDDWTAASQDTAARVKAGQLPGREKVSLKGKSIEIDSPAARVHKNVLFLMARLDHGAEYQRIIAKYPILQFLHSAQPDRSEVQDALTQMKGHVAKEAEYLAGIEAALDTPYRDIKGRGGLKVGREEWLAPQALELLDYSRFVEDLLIESPEYCGLATSLTYARANRSLAGSAAIGFVVLGSALVFPPTAALTVGLGASAITMTESQRKLNVAKDHYMSHVIEFETSKAADALKQAQSDRNMEVIMLPLGVVGAQAAIAKFVKPAAIKFFSRAK